MVQQPVNYATLLAWIAILRDYVSNAKPDFYLTHRLHNVVPYALKECSYLIIHALDAILPVKTAFLINMILVSLVFLLEFSIRLSAEPVARMDFIL